VALCRLLIFSWGRNWEWGVREAQCVCLGCSQTCHMRGALALVAHRSHIKPANSIGAAKWHSSGTARPHCGCCWSALSGSSWGGQARKLEKQAAHFSSPLVHWRSQYRRAANSSKGHAWQKVCCAIH